jgi:lipoyl(octanoyl) transferase
MSSELWVARLQTTPYREALALQNDLRAARQAAAIPDVLLLLEHWPVYTRGRRTPDAELPMGEQWYEMQGIEVAATDRGGRVTYHGPGQLVAYPIIDLGPYGDDVHAYVRRLERVMISSLRAHGVPAQVFEGLTGVWTAGEPPVAAGEAGPQGTRVGQATVASPDGSGARKVGSIGVHVSRGVTTHGLAINVSNDLQPFEWIVPCGIEYVRMTSLVRELGARQEVGALADTVAAEFASAFAREPREVTHEDLLAAAGTAAGETQGAQRPA